MNISIFGLGYVGAVTAGCLAELGHSIIGADVQQEKVDAFNQGVSPIIEPELQELMRSALLGGRLRATTDPVDAVTNSDVSIVCVGTPSLESGRLNLDFVRKVSQQIAEALSTSGKKHVLVFRSTMLPGSTQKVVKDFFEKLQLSGQLDVFYSPEFLREGSAVRDFRNSSLKVIGTHDGEVPQSREVLELFGDDASILSWQGAEMIKYSCNYLHALKVGFANEIGRLSKFLGEDGAKIMDVVCADTELNISRYYLKPGNPFGGSCLPKDVSALSSYARQEGISLPLLDNTLGSNQAHLDSLLKLVISKKKRRVGLLGLAFKAGTDDLRGSPMVALAETLLGGGFELRIFDPQLNLSRLIGANEKQIQRRIPSLAQLLDADVLNVLRESDVIVVSQKCVPIEVIQNVVTADQQVIDVVDWRELESLAWRYEGICW